MAFTSISFKHKPRNLKRKSDYENNAVMTKSKVKSNFRKSLTDYKEIFMSHNQEFQLKDVPQSIKNFFQTYIRHVQSINNIFYTMNQLFANSKNLLPNSHIQNVLNEISGKTESNLKKLTDNLINELYWNTEESPRSTLSLHSEPVAKIKKINDHQSRNNIKNSDINLSEKNADSEIDFSGSDIDLQLEEAVDVVCLESSVLNPNKKMKISNKNLSQTTLKSLTGSENENWKLNYDSDNFIAVYVDGACSSNGQANAQAGVGVWFGNNSPLNVSEPVTGSPTNNNAEIQAATHAIRQANRAGIKKIRIYTDSKFLINCMTQWISKWKNNNWITSAKEPVKNKDSLQELDSVLSLMECIDWKYVEGHKGIIGNEKADLLAKEGAKKCIIGKFI
ncbi:hypothetical protein PGB90_001352 [Kerria lacca]